MDQVLKRHPKEKDTVNLAHEEDEDREVYVFSAADQRRIAFRKYLEDHGIPFDEISTHNYRKGSATYTASGSTSAPPIVAICLRAGWKLGGVLNTYLSLESAGDRFVGRVCTLLPQLSKKFCVMSPRFPIEEDENDMVADENEALLAVIDTAMTGMFGDYRSHGGSFAAVLRHCLASLCFHKVRTPPYSTLLHLRCCTTQEWLQALPASHPFHSSYLAMNPRTWTKLQTAVGPLKYDGDDKHCVASGIPPWCHLALQVCATPPSCSTLVLHPNP